MKTEWRPVVGFEDEYLVSDDGQIYSLHRSRVLKCKLSKQGYKRICLCSNGNQRNASVHRVVAEAFIKNPDNKPTVNHINEIKTDNRVENLEWATNAEQNVHGTRRQRAAANTDWKRRTEKMDYKAIAAKHDYYNMNKAQMKPVLQYDMDGFLIAGFESLNEAARSVGISAGHICCCLKGRRKSCAGYKWKYA